MKKDLLSHLVCPDCQCELGLHIDSEEEGQIRSGQLGCREKGHQFAISRFVPRFVDADEYADSFSKQRLYVRRHFEYYRNDRSGHERFVPSTGFAWKLRNL